MAPHCSKLVLQLTLLIALLVLTPLITAQSSNSTIDPSTLTSTLRSQWCQGQINTCGILCSGSANDDTCTPDTLNYACTCSSNNSAPGLQYYTTTMPTFICQQIYTNCIAAAVGDTVAQSDCRRDEKANCGHLDPDSFVAEVPTTSASRAPSSIIFLLFTAVISSTAVSPASPPISILSTLSTAATPSTSQTTSISSTSSASVTPSTIPFDPESVALTIRTQWCLDQTNTCSILCSTLFKQNECLSDDLRYNCLCASNKSAPGLAYYTNTIPTLICEQVYSNCFTASGGNATAQAICNNEENNCGHLDPKLFVAVAVATNTGLGVGAKVGIAIGAVFIVLLLLTIAYLVRKRRNRDRAVEPAKEMRQEMSAAGLHEVPQLETKEKPGELEGRAMERKPLQHELP